MAYITDIAGNGKGGAFGFGGGLSNSTFSDASGAVSDLFAAEGDRAKAQGDLLEKQNYLAASDLAMQNEQFAETSTAIKQSQLDRQIYQTIGGQKADIAGAGFAESGSGLDLLRSSASQGALTKAVAGQQGLIQEAGYKEQSQSYQNMAQAAQVAADAENNAATGAEITGAIKGVAAVATLF
jgi:hypothetical protein